MGMPEPGGSVHVGISAATVVSATALFIGWWLLLWGGLDQLFDHSIFGRDPGLIIFGMGLLLAIVGIAILGIASLIRAITAFHGRD
jgi:hypothetical protein